MFVTGMCVHNGELITSSTIRHPDGTFSHWSRWGPTCRPGDLDGDGDVDLSDLAALLADFGCAAACEGDTDGDGETDLSDLTLLLANYGL